MVFPAAMICAALTDLVTMKIPNRLSLALVAFCFLFAVLLGMTFDAMLMHGSASLAMLLVGMGFFSMGWIGGGDAKLFAATAAWTGWAQLLPYIFIATLIGGALTLLILFFRRVPLPPRLADMKWLARLHNAGEGVPYGVALALAGLLVFPSTVWVQLAASAT